MMAREATLTETKRAGIQSRRTLRMALGALALILGLGCLALGGTIIASAHDTHPIEIDGAVADYHEITINGAYARNELRLTNDSHTYTFDSRQFHPALPSRFQKDARIQIWVDQGTTNVLAITLYDAMGLNPASYTTGAYDNPTVAYVTTESEAGALAVLGIALLIAGGLSTLLRGKRRGAVQAGDPHAAPQPVQVSFVPARPVVSQPYQPQHIPAVPAVTPPAAPSVNGASVPAIPLSQAAPTTPAPNRLARPTSDVDVDQLPTQKSPAAPPRPAEAGNAAPDAAASPFAAWGIAPQPQNSGAQSPAMRPPSLPLQPGAPPANSTAPTHPQVSAPPGSLPDFPTERMPTTSDTTPPGDVSDQPTRKSETVTPPDMGGQ